ncbi:MAG: PIN domain-containing protein [Methylovulum sp.]|nr:MAG: PIN domain-containing protein [Methylovulum sp.]
MKLFLDACSIIYFIESQQQQGLNARILITQALQNNAKIIVSRLSTLECRVLPLKEKDRILLGKYEQFFKLTGLHMIELTADVVNRATDLRANYPLRTPDALQMASALQANADKFLTGDKKLSFIQEIEVIVI